MGVFVGENQARAGSVVVLAVLGLLLGVLTLVNTVLGASNGLGSDDFALRLAAACFVWVGLMTAAIVISPSLAAFRRIAGDVRVVAAVVDIAALGALAWVAPAHPITRVPLVAAVASAFIGWSATFFMKPVQRPQGE
jgi:hypothetical protein